MKPARPRAGNQQCQKHVQRFSLTGSQSGQLYRSRETEETSGARRFISRQPNCLHHKCTAGRRKFLACSEVHEILRGIWERSAKHDGWWVGHYILMPDHVHLFARPEIDASLMANWMLMWKSVSSRRIAAALSFKPPIWQADYFDRYLRSAESYSEKWQYVADNAVRAGLVSGAEVWPYRGTIHDMMF